jgi:2-keto-4-pentenoate hydratase
MTTATGSSASASTASAVAIERAAQRLTDARTQGRTCPPVSDILPADDVDAAYAVQSANIARRLAAGARVVGRKIGLTNPLVQRQLGVGEPDFGVLLDDMDCSASALVPMTPLLQPKIEAEIAFVLARDLVGGSIDAADVAAATDYVVAALEIVDSRIANWDITIVDTVADNASSGLFVLGTQPRPLGELDLRSCVMTMWRGEEVVSTGTGTDCWGDPLAAVAWLATTAQAHGQPLRAGELVLSGALGPMVAVVSGDEFRAEITGLGSIAATFEPPVAR